MSTDPTQDLPSVKALLALATEAEKAKNEANTIGDAEGWAIENARQYALEALAWVSYVRSDNAKAKREHNANAERLLMQWMSK